MYPIFKATRCSIVPLADESSTDGESPRKPEPLYTPTESHNSSRSDLTIDEMKGSISESLRSDQPAPVPPPVLPPDDWLITSLPRMTMAGMNSGLKAIKKEKKFDIIELKKKMMTCKKPRKPFVYVEPDSNEDPLFDFLSVSPKIAASAVDRVIVGWVGKMKITMATVRFLQDQFVLVSLSGPPDSTFMTFEVVGDFDDHEITHFTLDLHRISMIFDPTGKPFVQHRRPQLPQIMVRVDDVVKWQYKSLMEDYPKKMERIATKKQMGMSAHTFVIIGRLRVWRPDVPPGQPQNKCYTWRANVRDHMSLKIGVPQPVYLPDEEGEDEEMEEEIVETGKKSVKFEVAESTKKKPIPEIRDSVGEKQNGSILPMKLSPAPLQTTTEEAFETQIPMIIPTAAPIAKAPEPMIYQPFDGNRMSLPCSKSIAQEIKMYMFTGTFDLPADASLNDFCEALDAVQMLEMAPLMRSLEAMMMRRFDKGNIERAMAMLVIAERYDLSILRTFCLQLLTADEHFPRLRQLFDARSNTSVEQLQFKYWKGLNEELDCEKRGSSLRCKIFQFHSTQSARKVDTDMGNPEPTCTCPYPSTLGGKAAVHLIGCPKRDKAVDSGDANTALFMPDVRKERLQKMMNWSQPVVTQTSHC